MFNNFLVLLGSLLIAYALGLWIGGRKKQKKTTIQYWQTNTAGIRVKKWEIITKGVWFRGR